MTIKKLSIRENNPKNEIEFELNYLATLTLQERFEMMIQKSNEIKKMLLAHGHRRPSEIIKH